MVKRCEKYEILEMYVFSSLSSLLRSRIGYPEEAANYLWLGQRLNGALTNVKGCV